MTGHQNKSFWILNQPEYRTYNNPDIVRRVMRFETIDNGRIGRSSFTASAVIESIDTTVDGFRFAKTWNEINSVTTSWSVLRFFSSRYYVQREKEGGGK